MRESKYAAEIMAGLEREGVRLTPGDVLRLNAIGLRVECVVGDSILYAPPVVFAGPVAFHELTLGAARWLQDYAGAWWTGEAYTRANCYAHANARAPGAFSGEMISKASASAVICAWWGSLPVTESEVYAAVESVSVDPTLSAAHDADPHVVTELLADVVAATGIPADDWGCESLAFLLMTHRSWLRIQCALSGGGDKAMKDGQRGKATLDMAAAVKGIRARVTVGAVNG